MIVTKNVKYYLGEYTKKYNSFLSKRSVCTLKEESSKLHRNQAEIGKIIAHLDKMLVKSGNVVIGDLKMFLDYQKFKQQLKSGK